MRYGYKVKSVQDYDLALLEQQAKGSGLSILKAVHAGCGMLVFDFQDAISPAEKTLLESVISAHSPIWFTWIENGIEYKEKVRSAADVDRVTAQRIRRAIGSEDPIQEQLKDLRLSLFAHDVALYPSDYTQAEINKAAQIRSQMRNIHTNIETIRTEGKNFKTSRGW